MRYRTGVLLVLTAGTLWSFQALIIRQIEEAGAWTVLVWRSLAMLPVLLAFLSWRARGTPWPTIRRAGLAGVIGGVGMVVAMGGAILAFMTTNVANAAFLLAASPFLAALLGWLALGERVGTRTRGAIALALVGIFIMVREGLAAGALLGNVAALVSALGFASFTVALRWRNVADSLPAVILGAGLAVIAGCAAAILAGETLLISGTDLFWCALMGVVTMSGGMILYTFGSRVVPSAELALLSNTEILLAPFWVWLFMNEGATPGTLVGGTILLTAILFNALSGMRRPAPA